jgi:hypothetical protein
VGTSTSHNPVALNGLLQGCLYFYILCTTIFQFYLGIDYYFRGDLKSYKATWPDVMRLLWRQFGAEAVNKGGRHAVA